MSIPTYGQDSDTYQTDTRSLQRAHRKVTGVLAALARRTPSRVSSRPGIWGLREAVPHAGCRAQPVTSDEVSAAARGTGWRAGAGQPSAPLGLPTLGKCGESREGSKGTEGGGGDGKKAPLLLRGPAFSGVRVRRRNPAGKVPRARRPSTPQSGLGTETQGRAKQEVPPPRRRHPRRGRRPRPEAVRGRRRAPLGGSCGRRPRERQARAAPREASVSRQDPQRRKERTVRGRHLLQGARVKRAVEREAALPRLLPTQLLRGFLPASRLCARPGSSHTFFLSEGSGGGPGATAACLRAR